ncbi:hypothetical protein CLD20_17155 [Afifella sp. IM 167]|nr:hypothetical protein [Afifella sp. IM 167]
MQKTAAGALLAGLVILAGGTASAQDWNAAEDIGPLNQPFSWVLGARYWYAMGETGKDLFTSTGAPLVSRLTYDNLDSHVGELFGEVTNEGFFSKANVGLGAVLRGSLQDEDFPPYINPYSSTDSSQDDGGLTYATIDGGGWLWEKPEFRIGAFAGYSWVRNKVQAYGCTQVAGNPSICASGQVAPATLVISQENDWHSVRLGLKADAVVADRWMVSAEGAVLPYVYLDGADTHHLRPDIGGAIPETGAGWGYQLEGMVNFRVTESFMIGLGGRYWHMQTEGDAHFGDVVAGAGDQDEDWSLEVFGVTAQAAIAF